MEKLNKRALFKGIFNFIIFILAIIFLIFLIKNDWNILDAINGMINFIKDIAALTSQG
jgi:UDP-N-acetylmuramyl pentapeptide phosphotransferase/UDP-N-acetylglucosamine-1-phosphate transferase|tara:strand:- start:805 stop:978 length:174 start_codon:yes stop_codon:yes gene_type:complete